MNALLDLLGNGLDRRALDRLSGQVGASPEQTGRAVQAALPLLLGALQRNASQPRGAEALAGALERDHDGSVLEDVAGFFGQPASARDARSLEHIFGCRRAPVENAVARASGLGGSQVMELLAQLAPLVLGALARARESSPATGGASSGSGGLGDLLGGALARMQGGNPGLGGLLGGLLDADGDGSIADDLLERALGAGRGTAPASDPGGGLGGLLGGLLGNRR